MKRDDLALRLANEGFRSDLYSLVGEFPQLLEGYLLRNAGGRWTVEYYERGTIRLLAQYSTEEDACGGMYQILKEDPAMRTR